MNTKSNGRLVLRKADFDNLIINKEGLAATVVVR